jgi:hydrogenase maturation protease
VDASPHGEPPGSLFVIEPDLVAMPRDPAPEPHALTPNAVFASVRALGGTPGRVLVVGCEPASVEERMELSPAVKSAVGEAVRLVRELLEAECERERNVPGNSGPDRATVA